jgi:DNA-binding winged helix-turn-helix (wHTH) protein
LSADDPTIPRNGIHTSEGSNEENSPHGYEFGDYWLNPQAPSARLRLFYKGKPCEKPLPKVRFLLLCSLVANWPRVVSAEELIEATWPNEMIDDRNRHLYRDRLYHLIPHLRALIGETAIPQEQNGYRFDLTVARKPSPKALSEAFADLSFREWLFYSGESRRVKLFLAAGVVSSLLCILAYSMRHMFSFPIFEWIPLSVGLSFIQFVVVIGALAASQATFQRGGKKFPASRISDLALMKTSGYGNAGKWLEAKAGAISSLERYARYWKMLLISWSGLYLALTFVLLLRAHNWKGDLFRTLSIATTFFNNSNSIAIALCFVVLNHPTVFPGSRQEANPTDENTEPTDQETNLIRITKKIERIASVTIIVNAFVDLSLVFLPATRVFRFMAPDNIIWAIDLGSGFVGGITLALYVGRVQSRFLGPSIWLPTAFYLYVVMQALFVAIKEFANWAPVIIEAALILKCLLYLYVAWLFKSGRLLFYLVRVKKIYETVNIEWQNFLFNLDS